MKAIRDAATLLILILLVVSVRIGHSDAAGKLLPDAHPAETMQALPAHTTLPACPLSEDGSEPAVTRTSTSPDLPANCRS
jgi:hypothetical protein